MKIVYGLLGLLVVLGAVYALAFMQIIPAQKIANKNAGARSFLKALHLAKDPPTPKAVVAIATPSDLDSNPIKKIADERAKLADDKAALDAEKAAFEREKASAPVSTDAADGVAPRDKLVSIYSTMDPDNVAQIMTHIPDKSVLADLKAMDEKRAGKVLAALPADRAAKLSELMTLSPPAKPAPVKPAPKAAL